MRCTSLVPPVPLSSPLRAVLLLWFCLCPAVAAAAAEPSSPSPAELMGIWKLGYTPGLEGVHEPSRAYLALLPEGRFYEVREDCCGGAVAHAVGTFEIHPGGVRLRTERLSVWTPAPDPSGSESGQGPGTIRAQELSAPPPRDFRFIFAASVVPFDDLDGTPITASVLAPGPDLNDSYCRIF